MFLQNSFYASYILFFSCLVLTTQVNHQCMNTTKKNDSSTAQSSSTNPGDTTIISNKIADGAKPVLVSDQFAFTEGPAVDKDGNVYFTDQPRDQIWKYDVDGKLSLFMEKTGRSNGMYFDENNNLISCADEHNELWKISLAKKITVLLKNKDYYNGPNDVWVNRANGNMYFTDPLYKRDYWEKPHTAIKENVYCLLKNTDEAFVVDSDIQKPNGIVGTPDGKFLFVADIGADKTYKYRIDQNGRLSDKQLFANQGSDGMTIDNEGAIYLTGKGVTIYSPEGKLLQNIPIAEDWTANVCFGGKNKDVLFITASKSVYTVKMNVKGVQ
jgi:gluconolactonase